MVVPRPPLSFTILSSMVLQTFQRQVNRKANFFGNLLMLNDRAFFQEATLASILKPTKINISTLVGFLGENSFLQQGKVLFLPSEVF